MSLVQSRPLQLPSCTANQQLNPADNPLPWPNCPVTSVSELESSLCVPQAGGRDVTVGEALQAAMSFQSLGLDPPLLRAVQRLGYTSPTQVQAQGIPAILAGRDVIGSARTGSGKTAAFLLPIIQRLTKHPARGTRVLVLSPTRELAVQTENMLKDLARGTPIKGKAVYGGVGMHLQVRALREGVDLITATPG